MRFSLAKRPLRSGFNLPATRRRRSARLTLERLEDRVVLSGFTPAQIRQAYGFDQISFNHGTIPGDGRGQTIAIIDPLNDPNIVPDANTFSQAYGLPLFNTGGPALQVVQPDGAPVATIPSTPRAAIDGLAGETSLDVEWAHAIAPQANILLVEVPVTVYANGTFDIGPMLSAAYWASSQPGVSAVSMSFGANFAGESSFDADFYNLGVTFVASAGDDGTFTFPASSPDVLAVGGTSLSLSPSGGYGGESVWNDASGSSGGGPDPDYSSPTSPAKPGPDVAYNAVGFSLYDSWDHGSGSAGWTEEDGTSFGAPQWAALIAIADQGRGLEGPGFTNLSTSQTLSLIHNMPSFVLNQNIPGSNQYGQSGSAVYGMGTPRANLVVTGLMQAPLTLPMSNQVAPGATISGTVAMFQDDTGTVEPVDAYIDWGDGTYSWGQVGDAGNGLYVVEGTHTYSATGVYTVNVSVTGTGLGFAQGGQESGVWGVQGVIGVSGMTADQRFVNALYEDFLDREADAPGLANWVGVLEGTEQQLERQGVSLAVAQQDARQLVASDMARSTEALTDDVEAFYKTFLNRSADAGGLSSDVNALAHGATEEQVISGILGSQEYLMNDAGGTGGPDGAGSNFITALYQDVLKRAPDPAGLAANVSALSALGGVGNQTARTTVALAFLDGAEFRSDAVETLYGGVFQYEDILFEANNPYPATPPPRFQPFIPVLLARYDWRNGPDSGPSSAEIAGWVNSGVDLLNMQIAFAASGEFYAVARG